MTRASGQSPRSPNIENHKQKRSPRGRFKADAKTNSESKQADCLKGGDDDDTRQLFPRFTPLLVTVTLWAIRVVYVLNPRNWWMVHPDEVYQSVEVAHIETFGYGFRTYDFTPSEPQSDDTTRYREMEIQSGMYALRSPVFPYFYVFVWNLCWLVGFHANPYVLWRVAHVTISSLLPLAVHRFVVRLYRSSDKGCVSAILVAASTHLNILGTHCLIHSFLAPFTFLALSMLVDLSSPDSMSVSQDSDAVVVEQFTRETSTYTELNNNNDNSIKSIQKSNKAMKKELNTTKSKLPNGVQSQSNSGDNGADTKANSKLKRKIKTVCVEQPRHGEITTASFIATLTCYLRPDVSLVYIAHFIVFPELRKFLVPKNYISLFLGASGALAIGIGTDFWYYGWGQYSCLNWLYFNIISGFSYSIFGEMKWWFYPDKLFLHNYGLAILLFIAICLLSFQVMQTQIENSSTETVRDKEFTNMTHAMNHKNSLRSFAVWILLLLVYSFNKHKETRFIHDVITFMFISIADILVNMRLHIKSQTTYNNLIRLILTVFSITQYHSFPASSNNLDWIYQRTEFVNDVNECIKYISEQADVRGVFYDSNLFMTGGMSLLHHDVPVLSFVESGFYEFGPQSRKNYTNQSTIYTKDANDLINNVRVEKSINEFNRASNYIALANAPAVVRIIFRNPAYNYIVLRRDRKFVDVGFKEVFAVGSSHVLKRLGDAQSEYTLDRLVDRIPANNNATILLHEGDVLFHMNQYLEATDRFYRAVTLNETLLDAYLPLQICYSKLGNERAASSVYGKCLSLFDVVACTTPRRMTRL